MFSKVNLLIALLKEVKKPSSAHTQCYPKPQAYISENVLIYSNTNDLSSQFTFFKSKLKNLITPLI